MPTEPRRATAPEERVAVLRDVPVDIWLRAQQHVDDLLRELTLMMSAARAGVAAADRLVREAEQCADRVRPVREQLTRQVTAAADGHARTVTVRVSLTPDAVDDMVAWNDLLDRLNELCAAGAMLTVPASADVVGFRHWCTTEIVRQVRDGAEPRPWPV